MMGDMPWPTATGSLPPATITGSTATAIQIERQLAGKILLDLIDTRAKVVAREEIASIMAACLADPDINEHAKSLAGYILQRLGEPGE